MNIVMSTGFEELGNYWGEDWFTGKQIGGSERIVLELSREFAALGHRVSLRLPYDTQPFGWNDVQIVGRRHGVLHGDLNLCFDQYESFDDTPHRVLVAFRSDRPRHADFAKMVFLSETHARDLGFAGSPHVGGGVRLSDYAVPSRRKAGRVICTSSPDRCRAAFAIGEVFPGFVMTYKPVEGLPPTIEMERPELIELQKSAMVQIYPLDPQRPSDYWSLSVCEAMAAGTPVITTDADAMPEMWSGAAMILPRPVHIGEWIEQTERLLRDKYLWKTYSDRGRRWVQRFDWPQQAKLYLAVATS